MISFHQNYILYSLLIILISVYSFIKFKDIAFKINLIDAPSENNIHNKPTPTGSGIIFLILFIFSSFCFLFLDQDFFEKLPKNYYIFFISLIFLSLISFYDDFKSIHPIFRLFVQVTLVMFCTSCLYLNNSLIPFKLTIFLSIYFWVYLINIINFTDGSDGFLSLNSIFYFISILFLQLSSNVTISFYFSLFILPMLLAFIIFNKPPAKIFMGDTGSVFIGFLVGYISLESILNGHFNIVISILSYPLLDCTITLIKKVLKGFYPWARMFDYYFLLPLKKQKNHLKVFIPNLIYNISNLVVILAQIYYGFKFLCLISIFLSLILILYYKKFNKSY